MLHRKHKGSCHGYQVEYNVNITHHSESEEKYGEWSTLGNVECLGIKDVGENQSPDVVSTHKLKDGDVCYGFIFRWKFIW